MELPAQAFESDKRNAQKSYGHIAITMTFLYSFPSIVLKVVT
jgi:hypothetical protein